MKKKDKFIKDNDHLTDKEVLLEMLFEQKQANSNLSLLVWLLVLPYIFGVLGWLFMQNI